MIPPLNGGFARPSRSRQPGEVMTRVMTPSRRLVRLARASSAFWASRISEIERAVAVCPSAMLLTGETASAAIVSVRSVAMHAV